MGHVTLSDGDIAALAREAVDHKDPKLDVPDHARGGPTIRIASAPRAWTVTAGGASSYITASMTWREALEKLDCRSRLLTHSALDEFGQPVHRSGQRLLRGPPGRARNGLHR